MSIEDLMRTIGVLLVSYLLGGGIFAVITPAYVMPVASSIMGTLVFAILLSLVIGFLLSKIPIIGLAIGAFIGSLASFWLLGMIAPISFAFGIEFAFLVAILSGLFDWIAVSLLK